MKALTVNELYTMAKERAVPSANYNDVLTGLAENIRTLYGVHIVTMPSSAGWGIQLYSADTGMSLGFSRDWGPNPQGQWYAHEHALVVAVGMCLVLPLVKEKKSTYQGDYADKAFKELKKLYTV